MVFPSRGDHAESLEDTAFEFHGLSSGLPTTPIKSFYPSQAPFKGRRATISFLPSPLSESSILSAASSSSSGSSEICVESRDPSPPSTPTRSGSSGSYVSSPLNPRTRTPSLLPRPVTLRIPSEDIRALCTNDEALPLGSGHKRASLILYRLADVPTKRDSFASAGDSCISLSSDSKYPILGSTDRGMVAYPFDPSLLDEDDGEDEDWTLDEESKFGWKDLKELHKARVANVVTLVTLVLAILALLVAYPIITFTRLNVTHRRIADNPAINSTGQATYIVVGHDLLRRSQVPMTYDDNAAYVVTNEDTLGVSIYLGHITVFSEDFDRDGDESALGIDPIWHISNPSTSAVQLVKISDSNAVLLSSPTARGVLHARGPFCMMQGFLEIAYQVQGESTNRVFVWTQDISSQVDGGVWLDISIDNMADHSGNVVWVDHVRLYQWEDELLSWCTSNSPTKFISFSPFLA